MCLYSARIGLKGKKAGNPSATLFYSNLMLCNSHRTAAQNIDSLPCKQGLVGSSPSSNSTLTSGIVAGLGVAVKGDM